MQIKVAEDFYLSASNYCRVIENFGSIKGNNLTSLLCSLLELYTKALSLPDVESDNEKETDFEISVPLINLKKYDHYWEVFNPYHFDEPVEASLSDDILDIYKDVKRGIFLYEKNEHIEAIWEWKVNFEIHWGSHAVDAIRALHSIKNLVTTS